MTAATSRWTALWRQADELRAHQSENGKRRRDAEVGHWPDLIGLRAPFTVGGTSPVVIRRLTFVRDIARPDTKV